MKTLYLVRHAKSGWDDPLLADHDRPLNARGLRDAPLMGARLAREGVRVDQIVTSTAVRARTTAHALADGLGIAASQVRDVSDLYAAPSSRIFAIASGLSDHVQSAMLVGHNPGISLALEELTGEAYDLPTCAVVECTITSWSEISAGAGRFVSLRRARDRIDRS